MRMRDFLVQACLALRLVTFISAGETSKESGCVAARDGSCVAEEFRRTRPNAEAARNGATQELPHAPSKTGSRSSEPSSLRRWSVLEQELAELHSLSELYEQRLQLLEELRDVAPGLGRSSAALLEGAPLVSEQVVPGAPPDISTALDDFVEVEDGAEEQSVLASSLSSSSAFGDFLVSKVVVPQEQPVTHLAFMPLRNQRTAAPVPVAQIAMPTVLVVAVQADGMVQLFTVSGDLAMTFSSGHKHAVSHLAVSPMQDEYVIATVDVDAVMRVHKVTVRPRRNPHQERRRVTNPEEEKYSQYLQFPANITVQFQQATRVPRENSDSEETPNLTAAILTSNQGVKYFVTGDSAGWITVITRNGTLHSRIQVSTGPVRRIAASLGHVVFVAGGSWGFLDADKGSARSYVCRKYEGPAIVDAIVDSGMQSRVLAADEEGTIWVFLMKEKRDCKVEHRFPRGSTRAPLSLASVRGYLLTLENRRKFSGRSELLAFNMSHSGKGWDDPARDSSAISWKKTSAPVRAWAVQKRYQEGDLLATLSEDGMEIEILELMMQTYAPPPGDALGNFKLPVFAVAMILVMGYQFVKQKGPFDPGMHDVAEGL